MRDSLLTVPRKILVDNKKGPEYATDHKKDLERPDDIEACKYGDRSFGLFSELNRQTMDTRKVPKLIGKVTAQRHGNKSKGVSGEGCRVSSPVTKNELS